MDQVKEKLISDYLSRILEVNTYLNLTRISEESNAQLLHIEDSLSALEELNNAPEGLYGDLGSGGGFPGVPLAIATGRETILIDSVQKKMKAVNEVLDNLGLTPQISTSGKRIEDLGNSMRGQFSVLTARALSQLGVLLELSSPLLNQNGQLICLKASVSEDELNHALTLEEKTGMKLKSRRTFLLSDGETKREILVFKKDAEPTMKLPRRVGLAQKKPL